MKAVLFTIGTLVILVGVAELILAQFSFMSMALKVGTILVGMACLLFGASYTLWLK